MNSFIGRMMAAGAVSALIAGTPLLAQTAPASPATSPASQADTLQSEMRLAQALADRGLQLYRYDRAAWEATDAMLRDIPQNKIPAKAAGWVTVNTAEGLRTTFYEMLDNGSARGFYQSLWNDRQISGKTLTNPAEQILSAEELRLVAWRTLPSLHGIERCTKANLNMVILPRSAHGKIRSRTAVSVSGSALIKAVSWLCKSGAISRIRAPRAKINAAKTNKVPNQRGTLRFIKAVTGGFRK